MGMFDLLLGKKGEAPAKARNSRPPASTQFEASQLSPGSAHSVRKDLLKVALRDMLVRNGIPQAWLSADMLRTSSPRREQGLHVRFLVRRWEPRLMLHGPALEQEFTNRLITLDPQAADWLMGFSWQFALDDASACPALPHPGAWTAPPAPSEPAALAPATKPGDIIEGPVVIPRSPDSVRAELEQMLALRDDDVKRHTQGGDSFAPTRPATL
jgi:hypothetical protein